MITRFINAAKIRNTIDTDFSGVGTYLEYPYIPRGEIWIDRYLKTEQPLLLALAKLERKMKGQPFALIRETAKKELTIPLTKLNVQKVEKVGPFTVSYVDGRDVRRHFDPYFLLGGHDLVYSYIPKGHIWIDTRSDPDDWKYTLIHETEERKLMKKGVSYADAHDLALAVERAARRKDKAADFIRG
ncbi:MAG TPA: hypothetical protein VFQ60_00500 [Patescibacteria group bacterium]|nr:hypothetical protein [Patescibacteria group bacterium]